MTSRLYIPLRLAQDCVGLPFVAYPGGYVTGSANEYLIAGFILADATQAELDALVCLRMNPHGDGAHSYARCWFRQVVVALSDASDAYRPTVVVPPAVRVWRQTPGGSDALDLLYAAGGIEALTAVIGPHLPPAPRRRARSR